MKCIKKALEETQYKPRAKWWGFVRENKRYLMRYHHTMLIFDLSTGEVLHQFSETVTDKAGVEFALQHFKEIFQKASKTILPKPNPTT